MKKKIIKLRRYVLFLFEYFFEKVRGLDFTLPAANELVINSDEYNGYCKTPEKHMEMIFESMNMDFSQSSFLDVGCGKGAVLKVAKKFNFKNVAGIDLDENLIRIARRNMKILKYPDVKCICANALKFKDYGEYDVFFFFNPFSLEILEQVLGKILESVKNYPREIYIIYHHPLHYQLMEKMGLHRKIVLYDKLKDYETYIYSLSENR